MKLTQLRFAELHNPLFHAGKNFGTKLDPGKTGGLKIEWDEERRFLAVTYSGRTSLLPESSIQSMEEGSPVTHISQHTHPIVAGIQSAQVETPFGHVFEGPGKGKK